LFQRKPSLGFAALEVPEEESVYKKRKNKEPPRFSMILKLSK
jgi:hypothetical protein